MANKTATQTISNWDWQNQHVQQDIPIGQFTNGKHVLIAFGPPKLLNVGAGGVGTAAGTDDVLNFTSSNDAIAFPVGIAPSFRLQSNKVMSQVFELGSDRAYQIPGRTVHGADLSRVFYNGPSLMKCMYAYYGSRFNDNAMFDSETQPNIIFDGVNELPEVYEAPGFGDLFLNLASDLFDQLFGILIIYQDSKHQTIGSVYLEECSIRGHSMSIDANSPMIVEGCSLVPTRIVPVQISIDTLDNKDVVWSKNN